MKIKLFYSALLATMILLPFETSAITSMKNMFGKGGAEASTASSPSVDQLFNSFVNAQLKVMIAQEKLSEAYGMKEQSDLLQLQIDSLSSSALDSSKGDSDEKKSPGKKNLDEVKKSIEISNSAQAQIDQYIEQDRQLDPKSKKAYSDGVNAYVIAVKESYLYLDSVKSFGTDTSMSGLMGKAKGAQTIAFVTKSTPPYLKSFFDSTKKVFAYAEKQKIKVPKDATSMLGD